MTKTEALWRGTPHFLSAVTAGDKKGVIAFAALFLLGYLLSFMSAGSFSDPMLALSPKILMFGSVAWIIALVYRIKIRHLSGYKSVDYIVTKQEAIVLVVKPNVGNRTPQAKVKVAGKWPLDGSLRPKIVGSHIIFAQGENSLSPNLSIGFLFLKNPENAFDALEKQIKLNARH